MESIEAERRPGFIAGLLERPLIKKLWRYSMTSVVGVVISQVTLFFLYSIVGWSALWANITAVAVGTVPTYEMSRAWVWEKQGKSDIKTEIVPFWVLTFLGLVLSSLFVVFFEDHWPDNKLLINLGNVLGFGVLWVVKFVVLDRLLFKTHEHHTPVL